MTTFVLVHGAFRGGWSWIRVRRILEARGHQVWTPSLTGAGDRYRPGDHTRIHLADWADDIAGLLHYNDLDHAVLVGHSQGGAVIEAAAQLAAPRIGRLCHLDAAVPLPGRSLIESTRRGTADAFGLPAPDAWLPPVSPLPSETMDAPTAAWITERLTPSPAGPAFDRLELTDRRAVSLPRAYAFCTRTPPAYPSTANRLRLDDRRIPYTWLDADHDAPLTSPAAVTHWLTDAAPAQPRTA
jgi:pimeloyl-ACP methyl ester carboxylesterase